ncbi:MAG: hypothetical protein AMK72_04735 [Planctomycetes bacterium SM23_25]|nr:MAG: hypothetical protein AMK72_04735 [Planctomycetes bacterium SM23_25]
MSEPPEVLLVEDNPADIRLTLEALKECRFEHNIRVVRDGLEATSFLFRRGRYVGAPRPSVILLDLNLPKKNGHEVLREVKGDENLKRIPVVVLTISRLHEDILRSYNLHANSYIIKPVRVERLVVVMKSIGEFWFDVTTLPPE